MTRPYLVPFIRARRRSSRRGCTRRRRLPPSVVMKTPLLYGFLAALGGALTSLAMYFTGMHDTVEKLATAQWIQICVGLVIVVTCLALAMREKRSLARAEEWGFGSAFLTGFLTGLAAAVIGAIF